MAQLSFKVFLGMGRMNIMTYICKIANSILLELAHSIGTGYPLKGCSSAEPFSVLPDLININEINY
jgi:hypothetical protein